MLEIIIPIAHAAEEVAHSEAQTGVLGTFGVNWKFFVAQLINFSIVIFIFSGSFININICGSL